MLFRMMAAMERAPKLQNRPGPATECASKVRVSGERVDPVEVNSILADVSAAKNGCEFDWELDVRGMTSASQRRDSQCPETA